MLRRNLFEMSLMKIGSMVLLFFIFMSFSICSNQAPPDSTGTAEYYGDGTLNRDQEFIISRENYRNKLYGFWLGECIANWTGLVTEMDKIGNIGDIKTGAFYTRSDWGKRDLPNIWAQGVQSDSSVMIDFVFRNETEVWGADDDTDIEYMYQYLLFTNKATVLSPQQIRYGWLKHIKTEEENYLWVSNQRAFDLMREGILPPETSNPEKNPEFNMIDAQLTTEIFGLFAPGRPDIAQKIANLPIRATASGEAAWISEFYVVMHSLASIADETRSMKENILWMADEASKIFPEGSYPAEMYDFVRSRYNSGIPWEAARDSVYIRYQVNQEDGYNITSKNLYCNGCAAAGINFAASLISLFYGEGDIKETIKIGCLTGWDADNPTSTWGGMLGFMIGKDGIEKAFNRTFSNKYNIHRTRQNFPNDGIDTFESMAETGILIIDTIVEKEMGGRIDTERAVWCIPVFQ